MQEFHSKKPKRSKKFHKRKSRIGLEARIEKKRKKYKSLESRIEARRPNKRKWNQKFK